MNVRGHEGRLPIPIFQDNRSKTLSCELLSIDMLLRAILYCKPMASGTMNKLARLSKPSPAMATRELAQDGDLVRNALAEKCMSYRPSQTRSQPPSMPFQRLLTTLTHDSSFSSSCSYSLLSLRIFLSFPLSFTASTPACFPLFRWLTKTVGPNKIPPNHFETVGFELAQGKKYEFILSNRTDKL